MPMWNPGLGSFSTDQGSLQMFVHTSPGSCPATQWLLSHPNQQIYFSSSCFSRGQGQCYLRYQRLGPCKVISTFTPWDRSSVWIHLFLLGRWNQPNVVVMKVPMEKVIWFWEKLPFGKNWSIIGSRTRCDMMEWQVFTVIVQLASTCTLIRLDFVVWIGTDPFPALAFNVPPRHDFGSLYGLDPVHNLTQRLRWQCCCCLIQLLMVCVVREGPGVFCVSSRGRLLQ